MTISIEETGPFDGLPAAVAALLRAWRNELVAFGREVAPGPSLGRPASYTIEVRADALAVGRTDSRTGHVARSLPRDATAAAELARLLPAGKNFRDVTLRVDPALVLRPTVRIPGASRRTLRGVLAFELARLTPIEPQKLYFDFVIPRRTTRAGPADVVLRIVQRDLLDEAIRSIHQAGASIASIGFAGDLIEADPTAFPVDRPAWLRARWRRWGSAALGALAVLLFLAAISAGYLRGERANSVLGDAVADAMTRAAAVEATEHRIATADAQMSWLVRRRQGPTFVQTLAELSRLVPEGTWLQELRIEGATIHASGYSKDASILIALIDRSGTFANAGFAAPVVRNPADGTDRFELTFERGAAR